MKNKLIDLRNHLFAQLERLSDDELMNEEGKRALELERANAISLIAKEINSSAILEIKFMEKFGVNPEKNQFFLEEGRKG